MIMCTRRLAPLAVVAGLLVLPGCESVALTALGVTGGTAASTQVNHTLGGIAYKTFNASVGDVHRATLKALADLDMPVTSDTETEVGREIVAQAGDREIGIEIETLTARASRMRVVAKQGLLMRDSATATQIIIQAADALDAQMAALPGRR
jgi:hypothetical protein